MKFVLAIAAIWVPCAVAVSVGLYFTRDIRCLWFLLIPARISVKTGSSDNSDGGDADTTS